MRTSSHIAIVGLTHAYSSSTAAPGIRPAAGRVPLLFGHEGTRSYLRAGRPVDLSRLAGRETPRPRTATHTNPHPRDFEESAR
jgi:hypothetical protein